MSETLGQVAYDAHWGFYDEVSDSPKRWSTHADECDMAAWQAAAEAVVAQHETDNHSPEIQVPIQAVIEAAKALFKGYTEEDQTSDCWKSDTVLDHRLRELFKTVCALQEARDE